MEIAVLGGGAGAHAIAADLALAGHRVRMAELASMAPNIAAVKALGSIELLGSALLGGKPGIARLALVTADIPEAVRGAALVMVAVPAYGHEAFMRELAECLEPGQIVVFNSGYFASLAFNRLLAKSSIRTKILFGETTSLIYLAQLQGPGRVFVKGSKKTMPFAAFPASGTAEALKTINLVYPQFVAAENVFATSLTEASVLVHPVATFFNLSRIELNGPYRSSYYDLTPGMGKIMDSIDAERQKVQKALGLRPVSLPALIREFFGVSGSCSYEAIRACPNYSRQTTPDGLAHRYVREDVPFGLVPAAQIGEKLGVDMSSTKALIHIAGVAAGEDFWKTGRSLEKMGLENLGAAELIRLARR